MFDTVIRNARLATADGAEAEVPHATIGIEDGVISLVDSDPAAGRSTGAPNSGRVRTIDAAGRWVLPGLVDCHTHFGAFLPFDEDLITETRAAAAGGVTTVFHVILEPGSILARLPYYLDAVSRLATMDMHFCGNVVMEEGDIVAAPGFGRVVGVRQVGRRLRQSAAGAGLSPAPPPP